ncbi:hypothetical protein [Pseudomonas canadensis]|uniref:hypothetical protein n=1 Tax=Pseudomonas canadensis TaxID=915099 RepID=UPI000491F751|nr:hypothetical protein [Pseudomonas canadensis]
MATGVLIRNCVDVRLDNISMDGMDTAFEIYDSEDIKLTKCHTDSSKLVSGERLKRFEVAGSSAFAMRPDPSVPPKRNFFRFFAENLLTSLLALVVALIAGYLLWRFGWTG